MKTKIKKSVKVQLDYKTFVMVANTEKLKFWLGKYPDAKIVTTR
ncbi:MAG: hypothetical protein ACXVPU_10775 [Bacteroidia bacterium]